MPNDELQFMPIGQVSPRQSQVTQTHQTHNIDRAKVQLSRERLVKNSVNKPNKKIAKKRYVKMKPIEYISKLSKDFKKGVMTGMLILALAMGAKEAGSAAIEAIQTQELVTTATQPGRDLVEKNTHHINHDENNYYYEASDIAKVLVQDPENFDKNLLGVYQEIDYKVLEQMDSIIYWCDLFNKNIEGSQLYGNFENYLSTKGIALYDENHEVRKDFRKEYTKAISDMIIKETQASKLQSEVDNFKNGDFSESSKGFGK